MLLPTSWPHREHDHVCRIPERGGERHLVPDHRAPQKEGQPGLGVCGCAHICERTRPIRLTQQSRRTHCSFSFDYLSEAAKRTANASHAACHLLYGPPTRVLYRKVSHQTRRSQQDTTVHNAWCMMHGAWRTSPERGGHGGVQPVPRAPLQHAPAWQRATGNSWINITQISA